MKIGLGLLLGREHGGGLLHAGCHRGNIDLDVVESSAAIAFQALALIPSDLCDNIVIGASIRMSGIRRMATNWLDKDFFIGCSPLWLRIVCGIPWGSRCTAF